MERGLVFDIQHFCVDDGPGIRTTVFLKGCPLRCIWCHNAEGLAPKIQLYYSADRCMDCGSCAAVCPQKVHSFSVAGHTIDRTFCTGCGACAETCPNEALRLAGRRMTVEEVFAEVAKDTLFYRNSRGGMTISGGEPLAQGSFSVSLARRARDAGFHVCVETSGHGSPETLRCLAEHTDLFLYDFKHHSPMDHKRLTGVDNRLILENLRLLNRLGKPVILRCPIIPGCNDSAEHYQAIGTLAARMENIQEIHIEPYHPFGVSKYPALGLKAAYDSAEMMDKTAAEDAAQQIRTLTSKPVTVT